jgi:acetyl-CoA carboxylase, biotin carboxylase subunit
MTNIALQPCITKLLIANRGEIAFRIWKTAVKRNIRTVIPYSQADKATPWFLNHQNHPLTQWVCLGPNKAADSYLSMRRVLEVAYAFEVDAIHPGYGFLSENIEFCKIVTTLGFIWVGPTPEQMSVLGNKIRLKEHAKKCGVSVLGGTTQICHTVSMALDTAEVIGYPVVLKACQGGGGKGIFKIESSSELADTFAICQSEALASFGASDLYIEKFLDKPRHIEVQVLGDGPNIYILGNRDCSIQRRNQKLIEEAPAICLTEMEWTELSRQCRVLLEPIGYNGLGTIEFLWDTTARQWFLMEMNTRIQVEHTITEELTGLDLVACQLFIAEGVGLAVAMENSKILFAQTTDLVPYTHSIQCRIIAEDPAKNWRPSPGILEQIVWPIQNINNTAIRIDTHIVQAENRLQSTYPIPSYYDSLLAKVIVSGMSRRECINSMVYALSNTVLSGMGVKTNIDHLLFILQNQDFIQQTTSVQWLENMV